MITLIVKGHNETNATREAEKRGIVLVMPAIVPVPGRPEVILKVESLNWREVMDWYAEPARIEHGVGYPDGTLLLYTCSKME